MARFSSLLSSTWAIVATHALTLAAQSTATTTPQFDVASVKMARDQAVLETHPRESTGRFRWTTQLPYLIAYANHMELWRISGDVPNSIFEIEATTDPAATDDQMRSMLQSVLADRFKMSAHRVTKEVRGFALVLAEGGTKMKEAGKGPEPAMPDWLGTVDSKSVDGKVVATLISKGVATITGREASISQLVETLEKLIGAEILDQTNLSGKYFFSLKYSPDDDVPGEQPTLFQAVKDLGLKLEKRKNKIDLLVVDHIEKAPTEN